MTGRMARKALVLGDGTRSFLSVIRSLGRGGVEVHVAWHSADSAALRSRYITAAHELPSHRPDDGGWKAALIDLMERERFDLVLPCTDPALIPLQEHRSDLEPHGRIYLLNDEAFAITSDKFRTNALARAAGVRVPREVVVTRLEEAGRVRSVLSPPVVLKPQSSHDPRRVGPRREVRKAYSWDEFENHLAAMIGAGPVAVQENLPGVGVGVELLLKDGRPLLEFQHVRLHEPLHGGGSSYRMGHPVTPALRQAALAILGPLLYTGVAMAEFKVDPATGDWALIEVNGRFWGSLPLAIASGVDFPMALFQLLVEGRAEFPRGYRTGLCCRNWSADLWWQWANLRADRSDPYLATRPLGRVALETCRNLLSLRERSDTLTRDDPAPGLAEVHELAGEAIRTVRRKFVLRRLNTVAARRRQQRHARAALAGAGSILFVCHGNICRSPFAAELARGHLPTARLIRSAGYFPRAGRSSPDVATEAATRWGVDLSCHRSATLSAELVREFDAIFVFDFENYERLMSVYGAPPGRVHFLGALRPEGPLLIDDPFGGGPADFERVYAQIADAIRSALEAPRHGLAVPCPTP